MPLTSAHTEADHPATTAPDDGALVTKAVMRAAHRLGLSNRSVAHIIGVSRPTVSRMAHGTFTLRPGDKPFELAVLLIRLFRSLDAIAGGDETVAQAWLRSDNIALGERPLDRIRTITGLLDVIAYLDARRAVG